MRGFKKVGIFVGGAAFGVMVGAGMTVGAMIKSATIRKGVTDALAKAFIDYLYDDTVKRQRRVSYQPYRPYHIDRFKSIDEFIFNTRGEAEDAEKQASEIIDKYGELTLADLNDLCGLESAYTDTRYGWTCITGAQIHRVREGYKLVMPKAEKLH